MSSRDPVIRAHQEWLGFLQPSGLVVSPAVLAAAGAQVNRNIAAEQLKLIESTFQGTGSQPAITDLPRFTREFFGWGSEDLAGAPGGPELPRSLDFALSSYGETLSPTYAVADVESPGKWLLLIMRFGSGVPLDAPFTNAANGWNASPQARLERLLKGVDIPIGLLSNGTHLRLVYASKGESTGFITFPIAAMCEVAGRPMVAALHMLLSAERLFTLPSKQRLPALLRGSRKFQNDVSTELAEQVLSALYELVRGFQAANESARGELLREVRRDDPNQVYGGLLATLLRLVFVLYAEDRDLLPGDPVWVQNYSVTGLFESLRADASRYPDTIDQRFGAWARLLTLFRMINDGASHGGLRLPARHGRLFDPDTYPFLEGRKAESQHEAEHLISPPRISDGVVCRVLTKLLLLDGERISYRALDVEQIGSVYEAMMGFEVRVAEAQSIALRPKHVVVNLESLLAASPSEREKQLKKEAGCEVTGNGASDLKSATSIEGLVAALTKRISPLTPGVFPKGSLYLQPTEERRRSGSHYTPRSLTQPIVKTTLEPILANLGESPLPEQILDLKVCDPAMGSGAFLVEACRFLGDALVEAWNHHGGAPPLPPGEDALLHARRLVAQRCLYGVDKNQFAVDLAKLSLWLATLAKDHPFTFLDHALRHGDSLVGLSREQIASFHWAPEKEKSLPLIRELLTGALKEAEGKRIAIHALGDSDDADAKALLLEQAEKAASRLRLVGNAVVAAFFGATKNKEREELRLGYAALTQELLVGSSNGRDLARVVSQMQTGEKAVPVFHWEIEFPEVFSRENPGFDAFVGNPPFMGGHRVWAELGAAYRDFLLEMHAGSGGKAVDLVVHFFRACFQLLRAGGTSGLVSTNTIAQGDSREAGLSRIRAEGGSIYSAIRRLDWPGMAQVKVSAVHVLKGDAKSATLDGHDVPAINSHLLGQREEVAPEALRWNRGRSFRGCMVYGLGFTFDDGNADATPIVEMDTLVARDKRNSTRIFPFVGGEDINSRPRSDAPRFIINFADMPLEQAQAWPDLLQIVENKVRPVRARLGGYSVADGRREKWWQYGTYTPGLFAALRGMSKCLALSQVTRHLSLAFIPARTVFSHSAVVFPFATYSAFAILQARPHELWARLSGSSMKDDLRYTPSDCFETFPFPGDWESNGELETAGHGYYEFRAALMVRNNEGLTPTYNRFHDPDEHDPDIARLREMHAAMDRAVLDAYGWTDIQPKCGFLLDYEEEESADSTPSRRRKPWRFRWPDEIRDEVLGRLLALNKKRAAGEEAATKREDLQLRRTKAPKSDGGARDLFDE